MTEKGARERVGNGATVPSSRPARWCRGASASPRASRTMYHVSRASNRRSIEKKGLIPQVKEFAHVERKPGIYLLESLEQAQHWAFWFGSDLPGRSRVDIWEVELPEEAAVTPDLSSDMDIYDAWVTYAPIPPEDVMLVETVGPKYEYDAAPETPDRLKRGAVTDRGAGTVADHRSRRPLEDTPAFKAWFAGSKVVDGQGRPLRVYHGTGKDFDAFDTDVTMHYFTSSPEYASIFAQNYGGGQSRSGNPVVYPVYLNLKNPFDGSRFGTTKLSAEQFGAEVGIKPSAIVDGDWTLSAWAAYFASRRKHSFWWWVANLPEAVRESLEHRGFDGIIMQESAEAGSESVRTDKTETATAYVAFRGNQIKSAIGNNGDFDREKPSITASAGALPVTETPAFRVWFAGSEVVDASGKPLVVYHGTSVDAEFDSFETEDRMIFFASDPKFASMYGQAENGRVIPCYLRVEQLFDYRRDWQLAMDFWEEEGYLVDDFWIERLASDYHNLLPTQVTDEQKEEYGAAEFMEQVKQGNWVAIECDNFIQWLRDRGCDGLTMLEHDSVNYAVFSPNQIKSAIGNSGKFDYESGSITASHKQTPLSDTVYPNTESDNDSELDPGEGSNGYTNQPERVEGDIVAPSIEEMIPKNASALQLPSFKDMQDYDDDFDIDPDKYEPRYNYWVEYHTKNTRFPLTLFRVLGASSPEAIRWNGIGSCWSTIPDGAIRGSADAGVYEDTDNLYMVEAILSSPDYVDWEQTLAANMKFGDEQSEINVLPGRPLRLVKVTDADTGTVIQSPMSSVITANLEGDGPISFFEPVENEHTVQPLHAPVPGNGFKVSITASSRKDATQQEYPLAGPVVDGLTVRSNVPNTGSIAASLDSYEVLRGIRVVPMAGLHSAPRDLFTSKSDIDRCERLAEAIRESGEINPLIVVVDNEGPYILEGGHRLGALHLLGKKEFPAMVALEEEVSDKTASEKRDAEDEWGRYSTIGGAVELNGNWGRLKNLPDSAYVVLYHATTRENAEKIMQQGFSAEVKKLNGGDSAYTYLGGATHLGSYLGSAGHDPVLVVAKVKKGDLEPDLGGDWKSYLRLHRKDAQRFGIDTKDPTAVDTYATINQVRARNEAVEPIGTMDPEGNGVRDPKAWKFKPKTGAADITDTPAFKRWFAGSKVVDDHGRPLLVYHGTTNEFDEFDCEGGCEGASFFTVDPKLAEAFAQWNYESGSGDGDPRVMAVYLSLRNPMVVGPSEVLDEHGGHSFDKMIAVVKRAKQAGHDGLHLVGVSDMGRKPQDQWAAFRPNQIKSAIGNNGEFDAENASITASKYPSAGDRAENASIWVGPEPPSYRKRAGGNSGGVNAGNASITAARAAAKEPPFAPWIGVDLDDTLAEALDDYSDPTKIGAPIPAMVEKVKLALSHGERVKIMTARMADREHAEEIAEAIGDWTEEHVGQRLEATNEKDPGMVELWDDKARQVEPGTGRFNLEEITVLASSPHWPTFEEFVEYSADGKPDGLGRLWSELLSQDPYAESPEPAVMEQELRRKFNEVTARLNRLHFPITIYRKVRLNNLQDLRTHEVGLSWTSSERKAQVIYGNLSSGKDFLLRGNVDFDAVNVYETIYWRMSCVGEAEDEIRLERGASIRGLAVRRRSGWQSVESPLAVAASVLPDIHVVASRQTPKIAEHYNENGFWAGAGNAASGILFVARDTGQVCLAWRNAKVHQGDCWGVVGGAVKDGMTPAQSAVVEAKEEVGYSGPIELHPAYVFTDGD